MEYEVTTVNPRRRKSVATPKRNRKGQFVKGGSSRKRNPAPRKRRRGSSSSSSTAVATRRRRRSPARRRNPTSGGSSGAAITFSSGMQDMMPVLFAHVVLAFGLRTFGKQWGSSAVTGASTTSPYAGQAWPWNNYMYALGIGYVAAKMLAKAKGGHFARVFWQTIVRECVVRFVWTEGVAKIPGAQQYLGHGNVPSGRLPGSIYRDNMGNTYQLDYAGRWQRMQGLTEERPLDGLEVARPLDGLVGARSIDRSNGGYGARGLEAYGGLMSENTSQAVATRGAYTGAGYTDEYNAVYTN